MKLVAYNLTVQTAALPTCRNAIRLVWVCDAIVKTSRPIQLTSFRNDHLLPAGTPDFLERLSGIPMLALPYPISVARTLIQIGYEPLVPKHVRQWTGKDFMAWPSIASYGMHA